jgi:hypothetical protein
MYPSCTCLPLLSPGLAVGAPPTSFLSVSARRGTKTRADSSDQYLLSGKAPPPPLSWSDVMSRVWHLIPGPPLLDYIARPKGSLAASPLLGYIARSSVSSVRARCGGEDQKRHPKEGHGANSAHTPPHRSLQEAQMRYGVGGSMAPSRR